jgi:hypothetical protein
LFKTRNATSTKNNLIRFIRPKILRDQAQAAYETDLKYNYMRDQERTLDEREALPLLPGVTRGTLNPLPPPPPPQPEHLRPGMPTPVPSAPGPTIPLQQGEPAPNATAKPDPNGTSGAPGQP